MSFCAFCVCVSGQRCEKQRGADWLARNSLCCSISSSFPLSLRVPSIIECGNELKQRQPSAWLMRHNETSAVFRPLLSKFFSFFSLFPPVCRPTAICSVCFLCCFYASNYGRRPTTAGTHTRKADPNSVRLCLYVGGGRKQRKEMEKGAAAAATRNLIHFCTQSSGWWKRQHTAQQPAYKEEEASKQPTDRKKMGWDSRHYWMKGRRRRRRHSVCCCQRR